VGMTTAVVVEVVVVEEEHKEEEEEEEGMTTAVCAGVAGSMMTVEAEVGTATAVHTTKAGAVAVGG